MGTNNNISNENEKEDFRLLDTLLDVEKKIDNLIMTKRIEIQEWLSVSSRIKFKIRLNISTSFAIPNQFNIPNFNYPVEKNQLTGLSNLGSIEVKIEGKVIEAFIVGDSHNPINNNINSKNNGNDFTAKNKNFSSLIKSIYVEFDSRYYGSDIRSLEWLRCIKTSENDGFILRRPIVTTNNFNITFIFVMNCNPTQFKLSEGLYNLLGINYNTKAHVIRELWNYISNNNLIDSHNCDIIHCNDSLKNIFGVTQFCITDIPIMLLPHLLPLPPQLFTINIENPLYKGIIPSGVYSCCQQSFEITSEICDFLKDPSQPFTLEYNGKSISLESNEIQLLEQKTKQITENIVKIKSKIRDYQSFINNPNIFINNWVNSQFKDTAHNHTSTNKDINTSMIDDYKSCEFFCKSWVPEYVHRYLHNVYQFKEHNTNSTSL